MKFTLILASLVLYVAHIEAQWSTCRSGVPIQRSVCTGGRHEGFSDSETCRRNANPDMWYWNANTQSCQRMSYWGCGGNNNRYCTQSACEKRCRRSSS